MTEEEKDKPLPLFRKDLEVYPGPDDRDGTPTFNVLDPVKMQYYRLTWAEAQILKLLKPGMTLKDLCEALNRYTTMTVTEEEIQPFFAQAYRLNLLEVPRGSKQVEQEAVMMKQNPIMWLLLHYLYIRFPLINPNSFLERTLKYVTPFASAKAFWIYGILSATGIIMLVMRFEEFFGTFPRFFNFNGIITYALVVTCVKIIHEFCHAYTATYYRVHVPTMGVALLVLWPVLYTDVTDSWKLRSRKQRLAITGAGVLSELIIAGLVTLGWALSEPGLLQSIFFVLASATWISTLLININPAMRFDGYYLLCDLWGIDNLQPRAFAITRWKIRYWLWGLDLPPPEDFTPERNRNLVIYSFYTWIYRLILYTTIAIFVYHTFTKALGIFLFLVEIGIFIMWPLYSEVQTLYQIRGAFKKNIHLLTTFLAFSIGLAWITLPLPRSEFLPSLTIPPIEQIIYIPYDSRVNEIFIEREQFILAGSPLLALNSEGLDFKIAEEQANLKLLQQELNTLSVEETGRPFLSEKEAEVSASQETIKGLETQREELIIRAEQAGQVYQWDETLLPGQAVGRNRIVGKIANTDATEVFAYAPEDLIDEIHVGQKVTFRISSSSNELEGTILSISPSRRQFLRYQQMADIYGGDLLVVPDNKERLLLLESYYTVRISLDPLQAPIQYGTMGYTRVTTPPKSLLFEFVKNLMSVIWRESSI